MVLSCQVTARGTLEGCSVVEESPADQDFGAAAMRMTRLFRMRPRTADGAPVEGGTVRIPITFRLPR
ncbi:MAG: energy transducer TonB [Phenylobacterium sp.]|nr:energy transducer TonB [Phenylobacterium sp.]